MPTLSCSKKKEREIKILYNKTKRMGRKLKCATQTTKPKTIKKTKQRKVLVSFFFLPNSYPYKLSCLFMVDQAPNRKKKDGQLHSLSAADKTLCVQSSSTPLSRKLNCGECSGDLTIPENDGLSKDKDGRFDRGRTEEDPSREG